MRPNPADMSPADQARMGIKPDEMRTPEQRQRLDEARGKLKDFVYDQRTGRDMMSDLDRAMQTALEGNNPTQAEHLKQMLDRFVAESQKDSPDKDGLSDMMIEHATSRLQGLKATVQDRVNRPNVVGDHANLQEHVVQAIDRALSEVRRKQTERNRNDGQPFTKDDVLRAALDGSENVRQAGASLPQFDVYDYRS